MRAQKAVAESQKQLQETSKSHENPQNKFSTQNYSSSPQQSPPTPTTTYPISPSPTNLSFSHSHPASPQSPSYLSSSPVTPTQRTPVSHSPLPTRRPEWVQVQLIFAYFFDYFKDHTVSNCTNCNSPFSTLNRRVRKIDFSVSLMIHSITVEIVAMFFDSKVCCKMKSKCNIPSVLLF